jgi:FAD/FMN-containing dehydrogenase
MYKPTTIQEVRMVVELARREGKELKAVGKGHSPSDITCTGDFIVDLKGIGRVLEVRTPA